MIALLVILGLVIFITWIWLVVIAFKESVLWGLMVLILSLFLSPIPVIIFAAMHWKRANKPFLIHIIATILFFFFGFNLMYAYVTKSMEIESQQKSGEITEEEAQRRMLEMFGMEVPPELRKEATGPKTTEDEISKLTEQLEKNNAPEPVAAPVPQRTEVFKPIKLSQAAKYIGKVIRVMTVEGVVKQGTLMEVRYDRLVLKREYRGGDFSFNVLNRSIKNIEIQEFVEY